MTTTRIRAGRFSGAHDSTPGWPLATGEGRRTHTERITFDAPFAAPPRVVAWIGALDVPDGANRRLDLGVGGVTGEGFDLNVSTWSDTRVAACDVTWIAHGEPSPTPPAKPEPEPEPEKLNEIEGIGPATMRALHAAGVRTYAQLAARTPADLRALLDAAGSRFSLLDPTTWPEQAALAAAGDWDALKALQDRLDGGRRPD